MNHLNSILIEGDLTETPVLQTLDAEAGPDRGKIRCHFTIVSNRYYRSSLGLAKKVNHFRIHARGKLGELCANNGHKGQGVRVIGSIEQMCWKDSYGHELSNVVIEAEHVEFRPQATAANNEKEKAE